MSLVNVDLGDGRIFPMEQHLLDGPFIKCVENDRERTQVVEYQYRGKVVHRSAHVHKKQGLGIESFLGVLR